MIDLISGYTDIIASFLFLFTKIFRCCIVMLQTSK